MVKANYIIGIVVGLLLTGILLPIGLSNLVAYNGTYTNATSGAVLGVNATMGTLVGTVIPVMAVVGLVLMFLSNRNKSD